MPVVEVYRNILSLFDARERRWFWLLTVVMVFAALIEVVSISSVLMLLGVLANPETIEQSRILSAAQQAMGYSDPFAFQTVLAIAVTVIVVVGLIVKATSSTR